MNTAEVKAGWAFHVHHDKLVEYCTDYEDRVEYVKQHKPKGEQELRLRLFRLIPDSRLPTAYVEAGRAYNEVWKAYDKAREARVKARKAYDEAGRAYDEAGRARDEAWKACDETGKAYNEAWKAYVEARKAYVEAWKAYDEIEKTYMPILMSLHAELCPDCPFNGTTIFSQRKKEKIK